MRRIRVMLAAVIILGAVGGALAHKVRSPTPLYCLAPITTTVCNACLVLGSTITAGNDIHYTPTTNCGNCHLLTCPKTGHAVEE